VRSGHILWHHYLIFGHAEVELRAKTRRGEEREEFLFVVND
jgi:hypothetical protein